MEGRWRKEGGGGGAVKRVWREAGGEGMIANIRTKLRRTHVLYVMEYEGDSCL